MLMSQDKSKSVNQKSTIANILVIDEDPIIGASVKAALEAVGHTVVAAGSEAEAMEALQGLFDVVFVHRSLPDSTCDEIVRAAPATFNLQLLKHLALERKRLYLKRGEDAVIPLTLGDRQRKA